MSLTRMSSRTRKNFLFCVLAIIALSFFATNSFAAPINKPSIPPTTPTSVFSSAVSCGYYPQADGRTANNYFTVAYNGLGFTTYGYDNSNLYFHFTKTPSSVVSFYGRPFNQDVGNLVNAKAGDFITVSAYGMAYDINSVFITFDDANVPGGKVYFKVTMALKTNEILVTQTDANRTHLARISSYTWSGTNPYGGVNGSLLSLSTMKVFGSQGLYFPVNELKIDRTLKQHQNDDAGANFWQRGQAIWGYNNGAKSTQKLAYVLTDKTGCEATSYIEIK